MNESKNQFEASLDEVEGVGANPKFFFSREAFLIFFSLRCGSWCLKIQNIYRWCHVKRLKLILFFQISCLEKNLSKIFDLRLLYMMLTICINCILWYNKIISKLKAVRAMV